MKPSKAQQHILWEKVEENMELVDKVTHDLQATTVSRTFQSPHERHSNLQPIRDVRITKKMLTLNFKEEESKAVAIKNKLAFMRLSQYKQEKALEMAKKNLMRLTSIRRNSLRERETLNKLREDFNLETSAEIESRALEVRSSRKSREKALQKWKEALKQTAEGVRLQNSKYHTISAEQKRIQRDVNSKKAERVRENLQKSRLAIEQSHVTKIESTKSRTRRDLESRYRQLNEQKRSNEKLFDVLKSETERLTQWQNRKKREVQEFKSMWIRTRENPEAAELELCRSNISFA